MSISIKKDAWKVKDAQGQYRSAAIFSTDLPDEAAQIISDTEDALTEIVSDTQQEISSFESRKKCDCRHYSFNG